MNPILLTPVESQQILDMFVFSLVAKGHSLFDSLLCVILNIFVPLSGVHLINFLYFFSHLLSLLDFVVQLALYLRDSSTLLFEIEHCGSVFAGFD